MTSFLLSACVDLLPVCSPSPTPSCLTSAHVSWPCRTTSLRFWFLPARSVAAGAVTSRWAFTLRRLFSHLLTWNAKHSLWLLPKKQVHCTLSVAITMEAGDCYEPWRQHSSPGRCHVYPCEPVHCLSECLDPHWHPHLSLNLISILNYKNFIIKLILFMFMHVFKTEVFVFLLWGFVGGV